MSDKPSIAAADIQAATDVLCVEDRNGSSL